MRSVVYACFAAAARRVRMLATRSPFPQPTAAAAAQVTPLNSRISGGPASVHGDLPAKLSNPTGWGIAVIGDPVQLARGD